jgi:DNA mismatch repair ATPase MutS
MSTKGTENADGAALFCSILGYFLSTGSNCPKVLASTHFHGKMYKENNNEKHIKQLEIKI